MANTEDQNEDQLGEAQVAGENEVAAEEQPKLALDVNIDNRSACERHITVKVGREDIDRYFDKEFSELMPTAQVPGFRPGRAPRKLVEHRFRKDISEKVKTELLMDSLSQLNEDYKLTAISEPDLDLDAVEIPNEGPMTFEFDLEVRPEFELPKWKGLTIEKPAHEVSKEDIDRSLQGLLANRGKLAPFEGPAAAGDYVTCNLTFQEGDRTLSTLTEQTVRIRPVLSFRDGKIEKFDEWMEGVRAGETRRGEAVISDEAADETLRGKKVGVTIDVLDVKKLGLPELTPELLSELGNFQLEADLRDAIKDALDRQLQYEQRQRARQQIMRALTVAADWDLPPAMLQRQSRRELQRAVLELQRSGFSDDDIRAHENDLRQNSRASTARALKEHFILERIAEDQNIEADDSDYDFEIQLIAAQTGESARRVRARLEKGGSMDVLRNQIIERKVIDLILENAKFKEVPYKFEKAEVEAVDHSITVRDQADIPSAKPGGEAPAEGGKPEEPRQHV